jgi:hypothetical protein
MLLTSDLSGRGASDKTDIPLTVASPTAAAVTVAIPSFVPAVAIIAVITPTFTELAVTETVAAPAGAVNLPNRPRHINNKPFFRP